MGMHFYNAVDSFNVYTGIAGDYPDAGTLVGNVPFSAASGDPAATRLYFEFTPTAPATGQVYWVKPAYGSGEGTPSAAVTI
jgi:hypothetical protein